MYILLFVVVSLFLLYMAYSYIIHPLIFFLLTNKHEIFILGTRSKNNLSIKGAYQLNWSFKFDPTISTFSFGSTIHQFLPFVFLFYEYFGSSRAWVKKNSTLVNKTSFILQTDTDWLNFSNFFNIDSRKWRAACLSSNFAINLRNKR